MRLLVIEAVCQPSGAVNEDRWGAEDGAVWLLDGATGIAEQRVLPEPSDALWLVDRVDAGLRAREARNETPADLLRPILRDNASGRTARGSSMRQSGPVALARRWR